MLMETIQYKRSSQFTQAFGNDGILYLCYLRTYLSSSKQYTLARNGNRDALVNLAANKCPAATRYKLRYCIDVENCKIMRDAILDDNDASAIYSYYHIVERRDEFYYKLLNMDPDQAAEWWYEYIKQYGPDTLMIDRLAKATGRAAAIHQYMYLHSIGKDRKVIEGLAYNPDAAEYQYLYCRYIANELIMIKGLIHSQSDNRACWWYHYLKSVEFRDDVYNTLAVDYSPMGRKYLRLLQSERNRYDS